MEQENNDLYKVKIKPLVDANKFRPAAVEFEERGRYTPAPKGTKEYRKYWSEQLKRSLRGFTAEDGDYITGYNYFYINFCQIVVSKERKYKDNRGYNRVKKDRIKSFPWFFDYDRAYFDAIEEAENQGKHLVVLKRRQAGYSYKNASMLCRNFYCIPDSKSAAVASEMEFLTKDGIITKAWEMMDFIDQHTAFAKKRQKTDTKIHRKASIVTTVDGVKTEIGYKSEVMGVSMKNDPQKLRGKNFKLMLYEEGGHFPNVVTTWQIARPSLEDDDGVAYGLMILFGTGSTAESDFDGLKDIFYNPEAYNCLEIQNQWDEGTIDNACGFFVPQYYNMVGSDKEGHPFMDKNGNSNIKFATNFILAEREKIISKSSDRSAIDRYIIERPLCVHGDTWVSVNGKNSNVTIDKIKNQSGRFDNGIAKLYKVLTENNRELVCTETHPIFDGLSYKPLSEYNVGDKIYCTDSLFGSTYQWFKIDYHIAKLSASLKIDEDWGKFIGFFMGDGHFYSNNRIYELGFSLDKQDIESIYWLENFIKDKALGNPRVYEDGGMYRIRVNNVKLLDLFSQLGLIHRKNNGGWIRKVHVPEYIIKSPKSVISSFLSGLFDSDGYVSKAQGTIGFYSKWKNFTKDIIMLLGGFGIYPKYKEVKSTNGNGREYFGRSLNLRKRDNFIFRKEIGFISKRKKDILNSHPSFGVRRRNEDLRIDTILSIEYYGEDIVYNLKTDVHYYSANGIQTHNSPSEACLSVTSNIFPKKELMNHLAEIRNTRALRDYKQVGNLEWTKEGLLKWELDPRLRDLTRYKLRPGELKDGAIVIWEHPVEDAPFGLYLAGNDPYDFDKSTTDSLGSTFIFKRIQGFEKFYDLPVAEYTGRPETANAYYENVRKLLKYYNATMLYENEKKGLFTYFEHKHSEHLLADQPGTIRDVIKDSKVQRGKGIHMNKEIKMWMEGLIKDYLIEEFSPGQKNLLKIYSEPLLEELINYNDTGNFDRVIAFGLCMIYREELFQVQVKKKKDSNYSKMLFPEPLFTHNF